MKRLFRSKYDSLFSAPQGQVLAWFNSKGYPGQIQDAATAYFQSKSGLTSGASLSDHMDKTLGSLGYTGTLNDKLRAFYVSKTGIAFDKDAETSFYNNTSLDFSGGIDSFVKLMLHLNNNVTDSEITPKTPTNNNVTFANSSPNANFTGTYYGVFNGSNANITVPNSSDFEFGSSDFTVDWLAYNTVFNGGQGIMIARDANTSITSWLLGYCSGANFPQIYMSSNGSSYDIANAKTLGSGLVNQWVHYAVVRSGNTFYTFENGIQQDTWTSSSAFVSNSNALSIGLGQSAVFYTGKIQEVRVSKGIARWTSNFTPPTQPYT